MSEDVKTVTEIMLAQAEQWLARFQSDNISEQDVQGFALWLSESSAHGVAFEQTSEMWRSLGLLVKQLPSVNAASPAVNNANVVAFKPRSKTWVYATAASLFAAVGLVALQLNPAPEATLYSTGVGEHKTVDLADGSQLQLNTNSRAEVLLSDSKRSVKLLQGEGYFVVAKDKSRPFIVTSCNTEAEALGTEFNVNCSAGVGQVSVTEGVVEVRRQLQNSDRVSRQQVVVDQQVSADALTGVSQPQAIEALRLSWRSGELSFDNTPFEQAIRELNRYSDHDIIIGDQALKQRRVSGLFNTADPQLVVAALERSFNLEVRQRSDGATVLLAQ
ncbi:hypothetical protein SIN8267_00940 [Sinobacterium norvegicum]|uniref:Uncharacterized protein n=1 Tax=Sinobacterium norvegicum TaxID=1641715 RepID=A0ABM9AD12_9GAMM|nr:FecR domain-containing protein [Sinobacterium norvegicum]CAH0990840.1 hypothetical protein SIN8267_00940 [Sinobacterium norvegicum]